MELRPATPDDRARLVALLEDERVAASLSTVAVAALDEALAAGRALVVVDAGDARRVFVAAGFAEEGVRRRAYDRHGAWQDGVHLGLVAD